MNILYLTHPMNGLLMIILPIGVGYLIVSKLKLGWGLWWAGSATFIISQILHIPFNLLFLNPLVERITGLIPSELQAVLFASVLLGLSAGIFEETARYAAYRWWRKDARSWAPAVIFGAGHGGIEAILLGLLVLYTLLQMITLRNANLLAIIPDENLAIVEQQINAYWSIPWHLSLLGALERAFVIPFHISAAVLVVQTLKRHQMRWLMIAILWHTFVDAIGVSMAQLWSVYAAEGILALIAILSIGIILALREPYQPTIVELPPLKEPMQLEKFIVMDLSQDKLDKTRYQ